MVALRFSSRRFARVVGEPLKAMRTVSSSITGMSRASVRTSFPASTVCGACGRPLGSSCANATLRGAFPNAMRDADGCT
jgi:hypothetical protein